MNVPPIPEIEWSAIAPVLIVAIFGGIGLLIEMLFPKKTNEPIVYFSLFGLVCAGFAAFNIRDDLIVTFGDMVYSDRFAVMLQILIILSAGLAILFSEGYLREKRIPFGESYPLILWAACGAMIMVQSQNLLMIFLGLEVLSISLYVLAGMSRSEERSEESAIKYFLLGAFASAFLLYGTALIYGATGSLDLQHLRFGYAANPTISHPLILVGLALLLVGLCFKSALVPFHQWTPDVYQGAPTNVTAFMAAGSKIAALGALYRVLFAAHAAEGFWFPALTFIAILTMTVGNVVALLQKDVKRILGYSSISNAGYVLVAILAHLKDPQKVGLASTVYFLFSYTLMTIGGFAILSYCARGGKEDTSLESLRGLSKRSPFLTFCLIVVVVSLVGIPPTSGFFGKFLIFNDALASGLNLLAIALAINSVISIAYYLAIVKAAFVEESDTATPQPAHGGAVGVAALCAIGIVAISLFFAPVQAAIGLQPAVRNAASATPTAELARR